MNLTDEQWNLLCDLVVVNNGDTSEFVFNATLASGSSLCYGSGVLLPVTADACDFYQLANEGMITIRNDGRELHGKPTQLGIHTVATAERNPWGIEKQAQPISRPTPAALLLDFKVRRKFRTHDRVAEALGLERSVYFDLKKGRKVSEETYVKAAHAVGCSPEDLKPTRTD